MEPAMLRSDISGKSLINGLATTALAPAMLRIALVVEKSG
jgi:hypothetical protein